MAGNAPDLDPLDEAAVDAVRAQGLVDIEEADSLDALKAVRGALLGDQAPLVIANRTIGSLEPSQRGLAGKNLGQARKALTEALDARKDVLAAEHEARMLVEESVDVTVPTSRRAAGARHPLETLMEEVADFFVAMGWDIAEGPEIEHEWFNFDSLNFDIDHPARQMQDTLY
ncbi:MAG: phenylalanine--tRNA ligase subunit alpha, partial [Thermobifida sp.]|nr:phenylalanine--tRNA ligase subunit alpha [Thermobifida sp.]